MALLIGVAPLVPGLARADDVEDSIFADFTSGPGGRAASSAHAAPQTAKRTVPVGADGAFTHGYELDVPPGRLGMTPSLRLAYSSSRARRSGPFGAGWSLALPAIRQDTSEGMPKLDSAGQYANQVLQGPAGRMVPAVGLARHLQGPTGASGTLWVPERERAPVRYEQDSSGDRWIEHLPDGRKRIYGGSNHRVRNALGTFAWLLAKEVDAHGNAVDYTYHHQSTAGALVPIPIVATVEWGANDRVGLPHVFRVSTVLEPVGQGQVDMLRGRTTLLNRVASVHVGSVSGLEYWRYDLQYMSSRDSGRDLLVAIDRVAPGEETRTTSFGYSNNDHVAVGGRFGLARDPVQADLLPLYATHPPNPNSIVGVPSEARLNARSPLDRKSGVKFVDVDGDGDVDVLYHPAGLAGQGARIRSRASLERGAASWLSAVPGSADFLGLSTAKDLYTTADFDRDGDLDGLLFEPDETRIWNTLWGSSPGPTTTGGLPGGLLCDPEFVCGTMCGSQTYTALCGQVDPGPIGANGTPGETVEELFLGQCACMAACLGADCLAYEMAGGPISPPEDGPLGADLTAPTVWLTLNQSQPGGSLGRREVTLRHWPASVRERFEIGWTGTNQAVAAPVSVFQAPSADVDGDGRADLILAKYKFYPAVNYLNGPQDELVTFAPRVYQVRGEHFITDLAGPYLPGEEPNTNFNSTLREALTPTEADGCAAAIDCLAQHLVSPTSPVSEGQACLDAYSLCANSSKYPGGVEFNFMPLDINADGLSDLVVAEPPAYLPGGRRRCGEGHRVYLNLGNGWDVWDTPSQRVVALETWSGTTTLDPLGILRNRSPYCRGSALHPVLEPEAPSLENLPLGAASFADLNSDGRLDIVFAFIDARNALAGPVHRIFLNTGTGFREPSATFARNLWNPLALPRDFSLTTLGWQQGSAAPPAPGMLIEVFADRGRIADLDGDGLVDVIKSGDCRMTGLAYPNHEECHTRPALWGRNEGTMPDLLTQVAESTGAWTEVEFMPTATASVRQSGRVQSDARAPHWVVDRIERAAGPRGSHAVETVTLSYEDWVATPDRQEPIGFKEVRAHFQNRFAGMDRESLSLTRRYSDGTEQYTSPLPVGAALRGLLLQEVREGLSWREEVNHSFELRALGARAVRIRPEVTHSLVSSSSAGRRVRTEFRSIDDFGFAQRIEEGLAQDPDSFFGGVPQRLTHISYTHDLGLWILGRAASVDVEGYTELISGQTLSNEVLQRSEFFYTGPNLTLERRFDGVPAACAHQRASVDLHYTHYAAGQLATVLQGSRLIAHEYDPSWTYVVRRSSEASQFWDGVRAGTTTLVEEYDHDSRTGALTRFTNLSGHHTSIARDSFGRATEVVGPAGDVLETHAYVDRFPGSVTTETLYDAGVSSKRKVHIDGYGRILTIAEQAESSYRRLEMNRYDAFGRAVEIYGTTYATGLDDLTPRGPRTSREYDAFDRVVRSAAPGGRVSTWVYEADRLVETSPRGFLTEQRFDWQGSLSQVRHFSGATASLAGVVAEQVYRHDGLGRLVFMRDADGAIRRFERDLSGRLTRFTSPRQPAASVPATIICRDGDGLPVETRTPAGRVSTVERDELGRPVRTELRYQGQQTTVTSSYDSWSDAHGRLARVVNDAGSTEYHYDEGGRVSSLEYSASGHVASGLTGLPTIYRADYTYDRQGGMLVRALSADGGQHGQVDLGQVITSRDAFGQIRTLGTDGSDGPAQLVDVLSYEPEGLLDQAVLGNGLLVDFNYHIDRRHLTEVRFDDGGMPWARVAYPSVDEHGNILLEQRWGAHSGSPVATKVHTYDELDRLTSTNASQPNGSTSEFYSYTRAGNLMTAGTEAYVYGDSRHPQAATRVVGLQDVADIGYDADGMATTIERRDSVAGTETSQALEFDAAGCLREVETKTFRNGTLTAHQSTEHVCGTGGERVYRATLDHVSGRSARVIYVPEVGEIRPDEGTVMIRPAVAGTVLVAESRDLSSGARVTSESGYLLRDVRGSVLLRTPLFALSPYVDREAEYDAWGNARPMSSLPKPRHGFVDREPDPTDGFVHFGRRVYDPKLRRWLSPDPLMLTGPELDLGNGQQLNLYSYAANNPIRKIDVNGTVTFTEIVAEVKSAAKEAAGTASSYYAGVIDGAVNPVPMTPMKGHERAYGVGLMVGGTAGMAFDFIGAPLMGGGAGFIIGGGTACAGGVTCVAAPATAVGGAVLGTAVGVGAGIHLAGNVHAPNIERGYAMMSEDAADAAPTPPQDKAAPGVPDNPYSPREVSRRQSETRRQLNVEPADPNTPIPDQGPGGNVKGAHSSEGKAAHRPGQRNVAGKGMEEHNVKPPGRGGRGAGRF